MTEQHPPPEASPGASSGPGGGARLLTLLVCDLVESTALVEELGDRRGADLLRSHDRSARDLLQQHGGREVDKSDGFLLLFQRPLHAVRFALDYHRMLDGLSSRLGRRLQARVGIHLGEVRVHENAPEDVARGAKPLEVEGLAKSMAARLASLATGGQTLLTRGAFELARRSAADHPAVPAEVVWLSHGPYRFQGVSDPQEVHEAGLPGIAPLAPPPPTSKARPAPRGFPAVLLQPRWKPAAILALVVLVALVAGLLLPGRSGGELSFAPRDWVVVAELDNRTGESLLDDSLDLALRVALESSRFANVVPASRISRTLARMERPPDTPLDRGLGVEVCQREGAAALILPRVASVAGRYALSAEVVEPWSGDTVLVRQTEAAAQEELLQAVDELAQEIRSFLGETLAASQEERPSLEAVTTSDLEALKAYSIGLREVASGDVTAALHLLERALDLDPEFATAHARLGTIYHYQILDREKAEEHWSLALENRDRLSEREKLYIEGSRAWGTGSREMLRPWFLLSSLYPDFAAGHNNLGFVYWWYLARYQEAAEAFERATRAKDAWIFSIHHNLGYVRLALGELEAALESFQTAWEMEPNPWGSGLAVALVALGRHQEAADFLERNRSNPTALYELQGRMAEVTLEIDRGRLAAAARAALEAREYAERRDLTSGRARAEMSRLALLELQGSREELLEGLELLAARRLADLQSADEDFFHLLHLAMVGKVGARNGHEILAGDLLRVLRTRVEDRGEPLLETALGILEGELYLHLERPREAIQKLRTALGEATLFQGRESLARAYEAAGMPAEAVREYEWLAARPGLALGEWMEWFYARDLNLLDWLRAHRSLSRLHHQLGEPERAESWARALREHWSGGDPGALESLERRVSPAAAAGDQPREAREREE